MIKSGAFPDRSEIFPSLINSLPLYVFAKDLDGMFIHANSSYCKKIGIPYKELIGKDDYAIHPKPLADKYREDDKRIIATARIENIEEAWSTLEGEEQWIQVVKAPLIGTDGTSIIGVIGVFWDITKRKRAEKELAEERNLLRTLIDNLPDYIYVKDIDSRFLVANSKVAMLMGAQEPAELIGRSDHDYFDQNEADKFRSDEIEVMSSGQPIFETEEMLTDSEGQERVLKTTKLPMKSLGEQVTGLIGIGYDITELRKAEAEKDRLEKQLHYAQKMETIGTLTAGIAHDFNNLLSVINGFTELMKMTTPAEDKNQETLDKVLKAGRSAAKLVGQLLAFSRKQVAMARVINLNNELSARVPLCTQYLGSDIELHLQLGRGIWPVRMDPAQLEQIVVHFAENIRDAIAGSGHLYIETENISPESDYVKRYPSLGSGEWVRFSFRDSGCGMTEDVRERVFEPFFSTKAKHEGSGLGLATVFGIVKQNQGAIYAESGEEGGAEFLVFLPRSDVDFEVDQEQKVVGVEAEKGDEVILVVEDDPSVQSLACEILSGYGYTVYSAANGAEALICLEEHGKKIDLLLTDVIMPGMDGKMVASEVERRFPEIRVIFMSGYADGAIGEYGILEDGVEFVQKPFSAAELTKHVRRVLDQPVN